MTHRAWVTVPLGVLLACAMRASVSAQAPDLRQAAHTAWRAQDGAPGAVRDLAQGADGALWIATERGLFTFDGVRFERYEPPTGETMLPHGTHVLLALPDSSLWVGHFTSGISVLHRGRVVTYGARDGLPGGTVTAIARDSLGGMWASTTRGLARLRGHRWEVVGPDAGYPGGFTEPVLVDPRGAVWAVHDLGLFVLERGADRFRRREYSVAGRAGSTVQSLSLAPDGSIWGVQQPFGLFLIADSLGRPPRSATIAFADTLPFALTFARGRPAVVTSMSGRLIRLSPGGAVEIPFSRAAEMSGDRIMAALYDREGSLWIGTPTGIDRFRETKLTPVVWPGRVSWPGVAADTGGAVWIAARNGAPSALFVVGREVLPRPGSPPTLTAIHRDLDGGLWLGGEGALWKRQGNALVPLPLPAAPTPVAPSTRVVHAIARARDGRLWLSIGPEGVYRQRHAGGWERFGDAQRSEGAVATVITSDSIGRTWLGYATGQVAVVAGDSVRVIGSADGLSVGSVLAISVVGDRVWIAGQSGVAVLVARRGAPRGARSVSMLSTAGEPLRGISGVVETSDGELWTNGADGVTRIPAEQIRRALADPGHRVEYERLDHRDGIEPPAPQIRPLPSAVVGTDGRLWFTTAGGVSWIDPRRVRRNTVAPPVRLRALVAGDRRHDVGDGAPADTLRLPPRISPISVEYTAFGLALPERVRFRHRLDGLDTAWHDAGGRREAFYTSLRPGRYRFRVIAANEDGLWNTAGASLDFVIAPAWDQTWWFLALVVVGIAASSAGAAAAWQWRRNRAAMERSRARFAAILDERTRVARELHDTLLGDMAGTAMQLNAGARRLEASGTADPAAVELLSRLGTQVQRAAIEARRIVSAMRSVPDERAPMRARLADAARGVLEGTSITVEVTLAGPDHPRPALVEAEVLGIVTEALTNAREHAQCRHVTVDGESTPRALIVRVKDDGRGFDPARPAPAGHWGLLGMRERAAAIGAALTITSAPGAGTEIVLRLELPAERRPWWRRAADAFRARS